MTLKQSKMTSADIRSSDWLGWIPIDQHPANRKADYDFCLLAWGPDYDKKTGSGFRFMDDWFASGIFYNGAPRGNRQLEIRELKVNPTHYIPYPPFSETV
jgi:hypothetical protein